MHYTHMYTETWIQLHIHLDTDIETYTHTNCS